MPSLFMQSALHKSLQGPWAGFLMIDDPLMRGDHSNICTLTHRSLCTAASSPSYAFYSKGSIATAPTKPDFRLIAKVAMEHRCKRDPPRSNATNTSSENPLSTSAVYAAQVQSLFISPANPSSV